MSSWTHRVLAGAGALLLFGALFALPVYASMSLCTMPCCHHNGTAGIPVLGLDMAACGPNCSVRTDDATETTVHAVATPVGKTLSADIWSAAAMPPLFVRRGAALRAAMRAAAWPPHSRSHVLNSVFRI